MENKENESSAHDDLSVDTWNYNGLAANKAKTGGWIAAALILGIELSERLTTLGIAVNLVTYIVGTMHLSNARAANIVTNFLGTSFILCLFGGFLADTFLGRYLTIFIFSSLQSVGVTILTVSTVVKTLRPPPCSLGNQDCEPADGRQLAVLFLGLYMTAMGTGGLKSSVSGFGSDQFDEEEPKEKVQMIYFFNWFFFSISVGSLMAVTVLVYIQDNIGRSWGYGICAVAIMLAILVFLSGTRMYRFKKRAGRGRSPLTQIAQVLVAAWRNRHLPLPSDPNLLYDEMPIPAPKRRLKHTEQMRWLDKAAVRNIPSGGSFPMKVDPWKVSTVTDVEELKRIIRMLPIWATTVMFWTVYAQMTTFSVEQATTMDRHIGKSFQIPPASLTVFFVGSILITIPIYDRLLIPLARRWSGKPQGMTTLQRIGVGLVFSALAMVCAALSEIKRLAVARQHGLLDKPHATVPLSVFLLIPQFFFVGAGEAFTYIGQLDFFIRESPEGMKTMSTGLFLSTLSLGFFFSSILVTIVDKVTVHGSSHHGWLADNLNRGKLYNFYWLLALLSLANFIIYLLCARWYKYKDTTLDLDANQTSHFTEDDKELNSA